MPIGIGAPIVQVDAFTDTAFHGNPAAVCILDSPRDDAWMQHVAAEMNLSETAFLHAREDGFALRWFTPTVEVDLCGHATLASAHVLWQDKHLAPDQPAQFHTRSGVLSAAKQGDWIELDFPATHAAAAEPPSQLLEALGVAPIFVGRNRFDYLVEVASEEVVRAISPNHSLLRSLAVRGVIVTSPGREYDMVSRFFAPGSGVDEDPVTGSAHCALAPYWAAKLGKTQLRAYQASPRGGFLKLRLVGERVLLGGQAVTTMRGELLV